jgi:hypothetical protein
MAGARSPEEVREAHANATAAVPDELWADLAAEGLLSEGC